MVKNLKLLSSAVTYRREGQKYIIEEINKPEVITPIRNGSKWVGDMSLCLLDKFATNAPKDGRLVDCFIEKYKLILYAGLCAENFYMERWKHNLNKEPSAAAELFFNTTSSKLSSITDSVLKYLDRTKSIKYIKTWQYSEIDTDVRKIASPEVAARIDEKVRAILDEMDYKDLYSVSRAGMRRVFNMRLAKAVQEYNIKELKEGFQFIFSNKLYRTADYLAKRLELEDSQRKLNVAMINFLEDKLDKELESLVFITQMNFKTQKLSHKSTQKEAYVGEYRELIDACIDMRQENRFEDYDIYV